MVFALIFTFLPPLVMLAIEAVAKLIDRRLYLGLHLVLVAVLFAFFAIQIEKRIFSSPAGLMILIALVLGGLFAYALMKGGFIKQLLDVLTPAPIVFLLLFVFFSDTQKLIFPPGGRRGAGGQGSEQDPCGRC